MVGNDLLFLVLPVVKRRVIGTRPILITWFGVIYEGKIIKLFETEEEAYEWIEASGSIAPYIEVE